MRILNLRLENFQGIRQAEFRFDGRDGSIYGDNGTGKTTVYNAFTWLLFGKASTGANDFTPKTRTPDGEAHNLDHAVECEMEIDGETATFKRVYHEVYKKTRGHAEADFAGHTTDYYINGVPKKEKEYQKFWEEIFQNDETPKVLSMPFYFAETLHWEKRRALLLEICGDISDAAVMESDAELRRLPSMTGLLAVEEYKKTVKAALADINRKIQSIPARIDEAQRAIALPDASMSGITDEEVEKKAEQVRQKIAETEKERAALIADNDLAASARAKISAIYNTITQGKAAYVQKTLTAQYKDTCAIQEHEEILFEQRAAWRDRQDELAMTKATVERLEKRRAEIIAAHAAAREEYDSVQGETFDEADTVCRYCGQDLPPDKADEIREAFNARKSERLEKLRGEMNSLLERGKKEASKEMLADAENKVTELENMAAEDEKLFRASSDKLAKAKAEFKLKTPPPFESTDDYKKLKAEIEAIQEAAAKDEPDTTEIDDRLEKLRDHETVLNSVIASNEKSAAQRKRIAELENQEKELGKAYEEAERALYLCDRFSRVKADMLTDKINEKFSTVSFQLFRKNITNDGVEDICDVMIPSPDGSNIPFQYANNSARINAGLEIIGVLGKHYGVSLPVFVDNSESVVRVIPTDCQLIKLAVSENDKLLRLVLND